MRPSTGRPRVPATASRWVERTGRTGAPRGPSLCRAAAPTDFTPGCAAVCPRPHLRKTPACGSSSPPSSPTTTATSPHSLRSKMPHRRLASARRTTCCASRGSGKTAAFSCSRGHPSSNRAPPATRPDKAPQPPCARARLARPLHTCLARVAPRECRACGSPPAVLPPTGLPAIPQVKRWLRRTKAPCSGG